MLNFAEQTGSGAVTVVWSFLSVEVQRNNIKLLNYDIVTPFSFCSMKNNDDGNASQNFHVKMKMDNTDR